MPKDQEAAGVVRLRVAFGSVVLLVALIGPRFALLEAEISGGTRELIVSACLALLPAADLAEDRLPFERSFSFALSGGASSARLI